jgi:hypothetical protein
MDTRTKRRLFSGVLLAVFMSGVITFALTVFEIGLLPDFASFWLPLYAKALIVAVPFVLIVAPFVERVTSLLIPERPVSSEHPYD